MLSETAGTYAVGDTLTLADIFVYPQMFNGIQRFGVRKDDYTHLKRVFDNLFRLSEFRNAEPEKQKDSHIRHK